MTCRRWSTMWAIALAAAFTVPAMACLCSNPEPSQLEVSASKYDQVFAGLIIWQTSEPKAAPAVSPVGPTLDPGYWIKSKVLVLRVWRGSPPVVAEVWTEVVTSCDSRPLPGSYFVALVKKDGGRNIAGFAECDRSVREFATAGPARIVIGGFSSIAAAIGLVFIATVWLWKIVRRRRPLAPRQ